MSFDIKVLKQEGPRIFPGLEFTVPAIRGGGKLAQLVIKCLLTNPGSDAFDPDWGAGLRDLMPKFGGVQHEALAEGRAMIAVNRAEKIIKEDQSIANLSDDELLSSLTLREVSFDEQALAWNVDIAIRSISGRVNAVEVTV